MRKPTLITEQQMLFNGWTKTTEDPAYLFEKRLPNRNPLNASMDSDIKLIIHGLYNEWRFAIVLPDGGFLNFIANTIEELNNFESKIDFYDPPF